MTYNSPMSFLFLALLAAAAPARAAESAAGAPAAEAEAAKPAAADKETIDLVNYFLKVDLAEASPKLVEPFLAVKIETLPKKLQRKAQVKQIEVSALLRLHDTKKKGALVQPAEDCSERDFVKPLSMASSFGGYEEVTEDELKYVQDRTKCTEIDLGCRFSMLIFFEKKKDRIVKFNPNDPIMAIVAESRGKGGGNTHFFGMTITCMH
jgi:hypothetical protein